MSNILYAILVGILSFSFSINLKAGEVKETLWEMATYKVKISDAYSSDKVRADTVVLYVNDNNNWAVLTYRAAALKNKSFPDASHAPWLGIKLKDIRGKTIYKNDNLQVATVVPLGGYHNHAAYLTNTTNKLLVKTHSAEIYMSGASSGTGGRPSGLFEGALYDLQISIKEARSGEYNDEIAEIIAIIAAGG